MMIRNALSSRAETFHAFLIVAGVFASTQARARSKSARAACDLYARLQCGSQFGLSDKMSLATYLRFNRVDCAFRSVVSHAAQTPNLMIQYGYAVRIIARRRSAGSPSPTTRRARYDSRLALANFR